VGGKGRPPVTKTQHGTGIRGRGEKLDEAAPHGSRNTAFENQEQDLTTGLIWRGLDERVAASAAREKSANEFASETNSGEHDLLLRCPSGENELKAAFPTGKEKGYKTPQVTNAGYLEKGRTVEPGPWAAYESLQGSN